MAYPVVQARVSGTQGSNSTSHPITLPSGITAGDMLVVVFSVDGNPTVTAPGGWTKLGQASNGTTVTGAVFWRLAAGSDTLTLTTSASEQSSHVTFRVTGARYVEGSSANGSSANSDPPLLTPSAGLREYLWLATRSGDSNTIATASPSGFSNLQSVTGGGQGASTNTAELGLTATNQNPATFTSAAEQWVAWTLAVYDVTATQTFATAYQTLASVAATRSVAYAVLAEEAGGPVWFSRLTNGYETWAAYGSAALVASNTFSAIYYTRNTVSTVLLASYNSATTVTGYDLTWFPRLTDGAATWAGQSVAEGTGVINGTTFLPISASQNYSAAFALAQDVSSARTAIYQVQAQVQQAFSASYIANGVVSTFRLFEYVVAQPAVQSFSADYEVLGIIGSVSTTQSVLYRVLASAERAFSAIYGIVNQSTVQTSFSATYLTTAEVGGTLTAGYWVNLAAMDPPAEFAAEFAVYAGATDVLEVIYQVSDSPTATLSSRYDVGVVRLGDLVADVYRYGRVEVRR